MSENVNPSAPSIKTTSIVERASQLKQAASEKGEQIRESVTTQATEFKKIAADRTGQVKDNASQQIEVTKEKLKVKQQEVETFIEEKPKQAVAIALGAGVIIGLLLRR